MASSSVPFVSDSPLIFNEFVSGTSANDRALELANISANPVSLNDYSIGIYRGDSASITYSLALTGALASHETYVIASDSSNADYQAKADLVSSQLINNGTYPMVLLKNGVLADVLGVPGYQTNWGNKADLVRKNEYQKGQANFQSDDWVYYAMDDLSHLKSYACPLNDERLLEGPHLTSEDFKRPYAVSSTVGGGGVYEVSVAYYGDGDTTDFDYPDGLNALGFEDGHPFRYQNIDTPEIQHGTSIQAQPWGYPAKSFNNAILRKAAHILVQSVNGGTLTETYGRLLGFVWYTDVASPSPKDYTLLNHLTVKEGYSKVAFSGVATSLMMSDGLSYFSYLVDANAYAEKHHLKVHGESDPSFSY